MILSSITNTVHDINLLNDKISVVFSNNNNSLSYYDDLSFKSTFSVNNYSKIYNSKLFNNKLYFDIKIDDTYYNSDYFFNYKQLNDSTKLNEKISCSIVAYYNNLSSSTYNSAITDIYFTSTIFNYDKFINTQYNKYNKNTDSFIKFIGYHDIDYKIEINQYGSTLLSSNTIYINYNYDFKYMFNLLNLILHNDCNLLNIKLYKDDINIDEYNINTTTCANNLVNIVYLDDYYTYSNVYIYKKYDESVGITSNIVNIDDKTYIIEKQLRNNYNINTEFLHDYMNDYYIQMFNSNEIYYNEYENDILIKTDKVVLNNTDYKNFKNYRDELNSLSISFTSTLNNR